MNNNELCKVLEDNFMMRNLDAEAVDLKIDNPDLFLATYLADEYIRIDPEMAELVQTILRNVGRKVLRLNIPGLPRYISRITFTDRLNMPHKDIFEIIRVVTGGVERPSEEKIYKIDFKPLVKEYQESTFVIHDQCVSEGTTTLNLFNILKQFDIKLIGTDIAMYYYLLTTASSKVKSQSGNDVNRIDNGGDIVKFIADGDMYSEGAAFDHSGRLKQLRYRGSLIQYHPVSRKIRALKKIASNFIYKMQCKGIKQRYEKIFREMKPFLTNGTAMITHRRYTLYRKKFLNPQTNYYPEIVFKEHDITKPFNEQSSIMLVFNSLKSDYFGKPQIETTIPVLCRHLKEGGLLFIGEGEFDNISYTVFQKVKDSPEFIYRVGKGADIEAMILDYSKRNK